MKKILLLGALCAFLSTSLAAQTLPGIIHTATDPATGTTYHLLDQANWTDSEAAAVAMGSHLVTINNQAEQDFITLEFAQFGGVSRNLWSGYNDAAVEGTWVWADGSTSAWTNWANNEPNNSTANDPNGEDYATAYPGGPWIDLDDTSNNVWFPVLCGVVEVSSPQLVITGLIGGATATITASNATPSGNVLLGYSLTGAGPTTTPFGAVDMSPPITALPTLTADLAGVASLSIGIPGRATGSTCRVSI
jgi:hypothetical protein